ncbi:MAG TPA: hypothetical protein P5556_08965 [Candidatus Gastranaerophilales bacterium]|nr:hypothetical protein [Candidatus Gastranaerophilales bacterium]
MSIGRDDIGILGAIETLKSEFIKSGSLDKKEKNIEISELENSGSEINDMFEKKSDNTTNRIEQLQQDFVSLEIKNQALSEIDSSLERIEKTRDQEQNSELTQEGLKEFEQIIEQIASPETNSSEQSEQNEESTRKINELRAQVNEQQQQLAALQQKLYNEVNSLVKLNLNETEDSAETQEQQAETLKNQVTKEIKENPEKSYKMQIMHFNKDLILAMLSLPG